MRLIFQRHYLRRERGIDIESSQNWMKAVTLELITTDSKTEFDSKLFLSISLLQFDLNAWPLTLAKKTYTTLKCVNKQTFDESANV